MRIRQGLRKAAFQILFLPAAVILSGCVLSSTNPSFASPYATLDVEADEAAGKADDGLVLYADQETRPSVVAFFTELTGSEAITLAILDAAAAYEVPPSLAFALAWEESRYDPQAFNRNKASIDRGLYQLNSASFPKLKKEDFYDPKQNAQKGLAHLKWCLELGGNEVAALAMYNAGTGRVSAGGTPKKTLDYVSRVMRREGAIAAEFDRLVSARYPVRLALASRPRS
jgi:soluble lytic murein transglycosylase-like protein